MLARNARLPGALFLENGDIEQDFGPSTLAPQDDSFYRAVEIRKAALQGMAEVEAQRRIQMTERIRSRPDPGPWDIGETVYIWRTPPGIHRNRAVKPRPVEHWAGPGTVIGTEGTSVVWVPCAGIMYRCIPEQVRRASYEEKLALESVDDNLQGAAKWVKLHQRQSTFYNTTADPVPATDAAPHTPATAPEETDAASGEAPGPNSDSGAPRAPSPAAQPRAPDPVSRPLGSKNGRGAKDRPTEDADEEVRRSRRRLEAGKRSTGKRSRHSPGDRSKSRGDAADRRGQETESGRTETHG